MTDPIADMLTRIRNAQSIKHAEVLLPYSKMKYELGKLLLKEGYIKDIKIIDGKPQKSIKLVLRYDKGKPVIKSLKRISRPGRRVYKSKDKLPWVMQNTGIAIISTSRGLFTDKKARLNSIGGEVICEIW